MTDEPPKMEESPKTEGLPKKGFSERFKSKPENAAKAAAETTAARAKSRANRSGHLYVKLHLVHLQQLAKMDDPVAFMLFTLLLGESFVRRGQAFELPVGALLRFKGLRDVKCLRAQLRKLEQAGLISTTAQGAPRPMLVQVPLAL